MAHLGAVDLAVVAAYAVLVAWLAWRATRSNAGASEYFLASRGATWPVVGLSLLASNISSTTLVGLAGAAYVSGIAVFDYEWMAAVVLVLFTVVMLPQLLRSGVFTVPEFLEQRYDRATRLWFALLTLFLNIVVDAAGTLYAGAGLLNLLWPQIGIGGFTTLIALAVGSYTVFAGMRAVMRTEMLQAIVLLGGSACIALIAFDKVGGLTRLIETVPHTHMSLIRPIGDPVLPWLGLATGVPILGFYFWCTNQMMVQRVLAARSIDHGRWGCLLAGLLKLPVLYLMVLPGVAALSLFPGIGSSERVYPTLLLELLPEGIRGLVLAGFLAAAMSSLAATINAASTLVTMDLIRLRFPRLSDRALTHVGRVASATILILAAAWAPQIARAPTLWQYLQEVLAYAIPPVVAIMLGGIFWRGADARGARSAILLGSAAGLALFIAGPLIGAIDLHFLYVAPILLALSVVALVAGSRDAIPVDRFAALGWSLSAWAVESAALSTVAPWRNYRIQGVALLLVTAALVFAFR